MTWAGPLYCTAHTKYNYDTLQVYFPSECHCHCQMSTKHFGSCVENYICKGFIYCLYKIVKYCKIYISDLPFCLQWEEHLWLYNSSQRFLSTYSMTSSYVPMCSLVPDWLGAKIHFSLNPLSFSSSSTSQCQKHLATNFADSSPVKIPSK